MNLLLVVTVITLLISSTIQQLRPKYRPEVYDPTDSNYDPNYVPQFWEILPQFVAAPFACGAKACYHGIHMAPILVPIAGANDTYRASRAQIFEGFLGIPYAKPPLGEQRFRPPVEWDSDETILAIVERPPCVQVDIRSKQYKGQIIGSEDCLYLNVYRPSLPYFEPNTAYLNVIVYLANRDFETGIAGVSAISPSFLLYKPNVIVVTIASRLGIFGYFHHEFPDKVNSYYGNAGLEDEAMGLRWVKENIRYFGGDPDKITVIGEASLSYHMMSTKLEFEKFDESKGFAPGTFQKAIVRHSTFFSNRNSPQKLFSLSPYFQETFNKATRIQMTTAPTSEIMAIVTDFTVNYDTSTRYRYLPVHEDEEENVNCYICKNIFLNWRSTVGFKGPTLYGYVRASALDWMIPWVQLNMSMPLDLASTLLSTLIAGAPEASPSDEEMREILEQFNIWDKKTHNTVESVNPYKALRVASALHSEVALFETMLHGQPRGQEVGIYKYTGGRDYSLTKTYSNMSWRELTSFLQPSNNYLQLTVRGDETQFEAFSPRFFRFRKLPVELRKTMRYLKIFKDFVIWGFKERTGMQDVTNPWTKCTEINPKKRSKEFEKCSVNRIIAYEKSTLKIRKSNVGVKQTNLIQQLKKYLPSAKAYVDISEPFVI